MAMVGFLSGVLVMHGANIFYYCYDHDAPTGGQKHSYEHVNILNKNGFNAYALHTAPSFRLRWFENHTRTICMRDFRQVYNQETDYIVLPEDLGTRIGEFPGKKVIFNKNLYHGFQALGDITPSLYSYHDPSVVAIFTISDHNRRHLVYAFPSKILIRVHLGIDGQVFSYRPLTSKIRQIVSVVKAQPAVRTLYHMLSARSLAGLNKFREFTWITLDGKTEAEVAELLSQSLMCVFLSVEEGLGRIPLEALSCGCITMGYGCGPLLEVLPSATQFPHGELCDLARYMERVMDAFPTGSIRLRRLLNMVVISRCPILWSGKKGASSMHGIRCCVCKFIRQPAGRLGI